MQLKESRNSGSFGSFRRVGLFSRRPADQPKLPEPRGRAELNGYGSRDDPSDVDKYVIPQLDEFHGNALSERYRNHSSGDLRVRLAGNELLAGMFRNTLDRHTYSVFVSTFAEASVGGPSPELDQLELLQYPRFTLWRQAAPDLVADRESDESRLPALLLASAKNLNAVSRIAVASRYEIKRALDARSDHNWLAVYGLDVVSHLSSDRWVYPGPLPSRI